MLKNLKIPPKKDTLHKHRNHGEGPYMPNLPLFGIDKHNIGMSFGT